MSCAIAFAASLDACTAARRAIESSICVASETRIIVTCVFIVRSPGCRTDTGTPAISDASGNPPLRSRYARNALPQRVRNTSLMEQPCGLPIAFTSVIEIRNIA